mmetsp:Transcript_38618/g.109204  ORF Transcript_38618/g.109204 Transcript_38618/m.109204 type:complete len:553 (+) Transcript_38618:241-1899(+)
MARRCRSTLAALLVAAVALSSLACATAQSPEVAAALERLQEAAQDPTNPCIQDFGLSVLMDERCGPWGMMDILNLALGSLPDPVPAGFCSPECNALVQQHLENPDCSDVLGLLEPAGINLTDFKASDLLNTPGICGTDNVPSTDTSAGGSGTASSGDQIAQQVASLQQMVSQNMGAAAACLTSLSGVLTGDCGFSAMELLTLVLNPSVDTASIELCSDKCTESLQNGLTSNRGCATIAQRYPSVQNVTAGEFFNIADKCSAYASSGPAAGSGVSLVQALVEKVGVATAADCVRSATGVLSGNCGMSMQEIFALTTSSGKVPDNVCKPNCLDDLVQALNTSASCSSVKDVLAEEGVDYNNVTGDDILGKAQGYCEENLAGREIAGLGTSIGLSADNIPPEWANPEAFRDYANAISAHIKAALEEAGIPPDQFSLDTVKLVLDDAGKPYKVAVDGTIAFFSDESKSMQEFADFLRSQAPEIFSNITSGLPGTDESIKLVLDRVRCLSCLSSCLALPFHVHNPCSLCWDRTNQAMLRAVVASLCGPYQRDVTVLF